MGGCFPNCHPVGQPPPGGLSNSGYAGLGIACLLLFVLFLMRNKSGS